MGISPFSIPSVHRGSITTHDRLVRAADANLDTILHDDLGAAHRVRFYFFRDSTALRPTYIARWYVGSQDVYPRVEQKPLR